MKPQPAAWQQHPEPKGTLYYPDDLAQAETVQKLFAACNNSGAYVTADGWQFLFRNYSLPELVQLSVAAGWVSTEADTNTLIHLVSQALLAGYDPLSNQQGDFDTETNEFISLSGNVSKINWRSLEQG